MGHEARALTHARRRVLGDTSLEHGGDTSPGDKTSVPRNGLPPVATILGGMGSARLQRRPGRRSAVVRRQSLRAKDRTAGSLEAANLRVAAPACRWSAASGSPAGSRPPWRLPRGRPLVAPKAVSHNRRSHVDDSGASCGLVPDGNENGGYMNCGALPWPVCRDGRDSQAIDIASVTRIMDVASGVVDGAYSLWS